MLDFFDAYHYVSNNRICTQSQNGLVHQLLDSICSTTLAKCQTLHSYHASLIVLYQRPGPSSPEKKPLLCYKHQQRTRCTGLWSGLPRIQRQTAWQVWTSMKEVPINPAFRELHWRGKLRNNSGSKVLILKNAKWVEDRCVLGQLCKANPTNKVPLKLVELCFSSVHTAHAVSSDRTGQARSATSKHVTAASWLAGKWQLSLH